MQKLTETELTEISTKAAMDGLDRAEKELAPLANKLMDKLSAEDRLVLVEFTAEVFRHGMLAGADAAKAVVTRSKEAKA